MTLSLLNRVGFEDRVTFTRQLATMLDSGIHLVQALGIVRQQIKSPYFSSVISRVEQGLQEGVSLSNNLAKFPNVFNRVYLNVVRSGEASGQLDKVLKELALQLEQEASFRSKIRNAMIYPLFIIAAMIGVAILTAVRIIPQLEQVFRESNIEIPWTTQLIISTANLLINQWLIIIIMLGVLLLLARLFLRSVQGQLMLNRLQLSDPSGLSQKVLMARFTRTLGMLLSAGVPIVEALQIVAEVMGNQYYRQSLQKVAIELERGIPMSVPLAKEKLYPPYVAQMMLIGEQTGKLDQVLAGMARHFEEQTDNSLKTITTLFEPVVIVLIGIAVGFMVFSIIVPIYQVTQAQ